MPKIINWDAVKAGYYGQENLNTKRKRQAEFLVSFDVPAKHIIGFGCYNKDAETKLINIGVEKDKIKIIPNAYY